MDDRPHHGPHAPLKRGIAFALQRASDLAQGRFHLLAGKRHQQRVLVAKILIERADAYARAFGHRVGREGGQATLFENLSRCLDDRRDGLRRPRLARHSSFVFRGLATCGHDGTGRGKASN